MLRCCLFVIAICYHAAIILACRSSYHLNLPDPKSLRLVETTYSLVKGASKVDNHYFRYEVGIGEDFLGSLGLEFDQHADEPVFKWDMFSIQGKGVVEVDIGHDRRTYCSQPDGYQINCEAKISRRFYDTQTVMFLLEKLSSVWTLSYKLDQDINLTYTPLLALQFEGYNDTGTFHLSIRGFSYKKDEIRFQNSTAYIKTKAFDKDFMPVKLSYVNECLVHDYVEGDFDSQKFDKIEFSAFDYTLQNGIFGFCYLPVNENESSSQGLENKIKACKREALLTRYDD